MIPLLHLFSMKLKLIGGKLSCYLYWKQQNSFPIVVVMGAMWKTNSWLEVVTSLESNCLAKTQWMEQGNVHGRNV